MYKHIGGAALTLAFALASTVVASAQYYGGYGVPSGSYQQSCSRIRMHGSTLIASCSNENGQPVRSSIDINQCRGGDIANNNGYLTCNGGYGNNGWHRHHENDAPGGSYQQSCSNVRMNGSTLSASCAAGNGQQIYSSINVYNCRGNDIANRNGYLSC